ncbi:MAG TPA: SMP-30/gluconolactonase/LRE family protein [Chitinophagaceae bacterium]|jgi:sugar lactone lactonase YvrE|nr:SMP-30/gluconolactonase/LRE family protein [Chitinophagaceae bacterium]
MRKLWICLSLIFLFSCKSGKSGRSFNNSLFIAQDFTAENLFSRNIEGPAVDMQGRLFVVNYQRDGTIGLVKPDGTCEMFVELPEKSTGNSIQVRKDGNLFVADYTGHNILLVDVKTKLVTVFCHNDAFNQPNDICLNKRGEIYASDPNWKDSTGKIWLINNLGKATLLTGDMGTTNGICLSPNEKILYVNESFQRKVWAFDVDAKGNLSNKRLFTSFPDYNLDGMKCDFKGNLYICRYGKGVVSIFSPLGKEIQQVKLKGKSVSNITFGGVDYKTCFVTMQDRKAIERFRTDIPGK